MAFSKITLPTFSEKRTNGRGWVKYGENNNFPIFLQELQQRSSLHNAILQSKLDYSYAEGLTVENTNLSTDLFISHPNSRETLNEIYRKCLADYVLFGGYALNVIWGKGKENVSEVYHVPFEKIRCGVKDSFGNINQYYYNNDWGKTTSEIKEINAFAPSNREGGQILYVTRYQSGTEYYPLPSYCGALSDIATSCEISNFHLCNISNNMMPSTMITFTNGIPTEEERRKIKQQFVDEYTSTDNAGRFVVSFVEDADKAPKIEAIGNTDNGEAYNNLYNTVQTSILAGHQVVSPYLVGIRQDGVSFGSGTELANSFRLYYNTVIRNIQTKVVEGLNNILRYTAGYEVARLLPTKPVIEFE